MAEPTAASMDAIEIADFLAAQPAGVLAVAQDDRVYAVPISFAYDQADAAIYFRLGYGPDSQKRPFVEGADEATFVVYDRTDDGWTSVIAEGRPEVLTESAIDVAVVQALDRLHIPFFEVFKRPADELEFVIVRLALDKLSGLAEAQQAR